MFKREPTDLKPTQSTLTGIYRGVVEDNVDPLKAGRCKIRVFSIHTNKKMKDEYEGIPTDELPWAEPALGITEGSVTGFGVWSVPLQGSHVFVFFESGHIMNPRYFASVPGVPTEAPDTSDGFNDPAGQYPNTSSTEPTKPNALNEADYHRLARGETGNTPVSYRNANLDTGVQQADGGTWDEPSSAYAASYPHNVVFATHAGLVIEVDSTSGNERYHIFHPSNTFIEVDVDGNVIVKNAKKKYEIVGDDKNIHIILDHNQTVDGQRTDRVALDEIRYVGQTRDEEVVEDIEQDVGENKYITIGINEEKNVGQDQKVDIGNDEERTIGNNLTTEIGNDDTRDIGNDYTVTIGAECTVEAAEDITVESTGGDILLKSSNQVQIECPNGIVFVNSGQVNCSNDVIINSDTEVHINKP